jgi:Icc-related predicted phosphoesterase
MPKFLIIGDLHGIKPRIHFKDFDAIIATGDFCSWNDYLREVYSKAYKEFLKDPYNYRKWWEITGKRKAKEIIKESLGEGREILEFLDSFNIPTYIVPGNTDWTKIKSKFYLKSRWDYLEQDHFEKLIKRLDNIIDCDRKIIDLEEYQIVGYGKCNGPELFKYRDYEKIFKKEDIERNKKYYEKLLQKYGNLFKKATSKEKPIIFLSHNVPFNTRIDKITDKKSPRYGYHYGSTIVREIIEKYQPLVCIGGHMHEHFGKCKIGNTVCINAGYGKDANILMELGRDKIKKLKFYKKK